MKRSKYTKGPWRVDTNGVITGGKGFCSSVAETPIVKWRQASKDGQIEESQANGALIAKAPDMMEALTFSRKWLTPVYDTLEVIGEKEALSYLQRVLSEINRVLS